MGIYDRDYYPREERPGFSLQTPRTAIGALIAINVAVWLVDFLTPATPWGGRWLSDHMAVHVNTLSQPWLWWQYLTAGFAHTPQRFEHILFNMLALYFLGRDVERVYGTREFIRLYLVMVVFASVVWDVVNWLGGTPGIVQAYGASGALAGVVVLFALNFPRATVLLFFVLPIPAWLLGVFVVGMDIYGALGQGETSNIAYSMHLAGAAFGFIYFQQGWSFTRLTQDRFRWPRFSLRKKPRLHVHQPPAEEESDLSREVDRILEKIYREGEANLTAQERRTLEKASREYQRRGNTGP